MKKYLLVLLLVLAFSVMIVSVASAQAVVITDFYCSGWATTTTGDYWLMQTNPDNIAVQSSSGNVQLTCHFDASHIPNLVPSRTRGIGCNTLFGYTEYSFMVTSPDDAAVMLKCMIKK